MTERTLKQKLGDKKSRRFFTKEFRETTEIKSYYMLVDTKMRERTANENVYLSFFKSSAGWRGCLVGTLTFLKDRVDMKRDISINSDMVDHKELYEGVSEILGKPTSLLSTRKVFQGYLNSIKARVETLVDMQNTKDFVLVGKRSVVIKTPLIDKFNNNILLRFSMTSGGKVLKGSLVESKSSLLAESDFTSSEVKKDIKVIEFITNTSDLVFQGDIEDFDLFSFRRLTHCLEERSNRFPDDIENLDLDELSTLFKNTIREAVKISKYDYSYIKPFYYYAQNRLSFAIPFSRKGGVVLEPELGIVISNNGGLWVPMTILPVEECNTNFRTLAPYSQGWVDGSSEKKDALTRNIDFLTEQENAEKRRSKKKDALTRNIDFLTEQEHADEHRNEHQIL